jgi:hypothetical protein
MLRHLPEARSIASTMGRWFIVFVIQYLVYTVHQIALPQRNLRFNGATGPIYT